MYSSGPLRQFGIELQAEVAVELFSALAFSDDDGNRAVFRGTATGKKQPVLEHAHRIVGRENVKRAIRGHSVRAQQGKNDNRFNAQVGSATYNRREHAPFLNGVPSQPCSQYTSSRRSLWPAKTDPRIL